MDPLTSTLTAAMYFLVQRFMIKNQAINLEKMKEIWISKDLKYLYLKYILDPESQLTEKIEIKTMIPIRNMNFSLKQFEALKTEIFYPIFFRVDLTSHWSQKRKDRLEKAQESMRNRMNDK